jgi:glycosyltransferase involved in cell wall biosynthesis
VSDRGAVSAPLRSSRVPLEPNYPWEPRLTSQSRARSRLRLVIAGDGPELAHLREITQDDDRVLFLTDVEDEEKPLLMNGCAAYALPTKPEPDFVETFGIALTEKMLAGGGPVITTATAVALTG